MRLGTPASIGAKGRLHILIKLPSRMIVLHSPPGQSTLSIRVRGQARPAFIARCFFFCQFNCLPRHTTPPKCDPSHGGSHSQEIVMLHYSDDPSPGTTRIDVFLRHHRHRHLVDDRHQNGLPRRLHDRRQNRLLLRALRADEPYLR